MAIESNRLVVRTKSLQKTGALDTAAPACALIASVAPPAAYVGSNLSIVNQTPDYIGQVRFVETEEKGIYNMYVVVDISGKRTWKRCAFVSGTLDSRTGQPYDPLLGFYSPLAN